MAKPEDLVDGKGAMTWAQWWEKKDITNAELIEAIMKQNTQLVAELLDEKI